MHKWIVGGPKDIWRAEVTYSYKDNQQLYRIWYKKDIFVELDDAFIRAHTAQYFPQIIRPYIEAYKEEYGQP